MSALLLGIARLVGDAGSGPAYSPLTPFKRKTYAPVSPAGGGGTLQYVKEIKASVTIPRRDPGRWAEKQ